MQTLAIGRIKPQRESVLDKMKSRQEKWKIKLE